MNDYRLKTHIGWEQDPRIPAESFCLREMLLMLQYLYQAGIDVLVNAAPKIGFGPLTLVIIKHNGGRALIRSWRVNRSVYMCFKEQLPIRTPPYNLRR
ncbi:hypothetical protein ABIE12_002678 [Serratia sp. 509]